MRDKRASLGGEFKPDPFEMQIAALVIKRRSEFLLQPSSSTARRLDEARKMIRTSGAASPFAAVPSPRATPIEIFLETETQVGLTERILSPHVGMEIRHVCLTVRDEVEPPQMTYVPWTPGALAVGELIKHPDGRWQVLHAELRQPTTVGHLFIAVGRLNCAGEFRLKRDHRLYQVTSRS